MPTHDLHIGQDVLYQDAGRKWWYPPPIPTYVHSKEVTALPQDKVSPTGRHKLT